MKVKWYILLIIILVVFTSESHPNSWGIHAGLGVPVGQFSAPSKKDLPDDIGAKIGFALAISRLSTQRYFDLSIEFDYTLFGDKFVQKTSDGLTAIHFHHHFFIASLGIEKTLLKLNDYQPFVGMKADFVVHRTGVKVTGYRFDRDLSDDFDMIIVPGISLFFGNYYELTEKVRLKFQSQWSIVFSGKREGGIWRTGNQSKKISYPYDYHSTTMSFISLNVGLIYQF